MDEDRDITNELERLQSNIATLFKSLINDKNKYKYERDKSVDSVESLTAEITVLRKENEQLKKSNDKISCVTCSDLRQQLMMQDVRTKRLEKNLDVLREMLCNVPYNSGNPSLSKLVPQVLDELKSENEVKDARGKSLTNLDDISKTKEEDELIIYDTFYENVKPSNHIASHMTNGEAKSGRHDGQPIRTQSEDSYLDLMPSGAESKARFELLDAEFRTPKKADKSEIDFISSPSAIHKKINKGETSPILVDQRLLVNRNGFCGSPNFLKRKASEIVWYGVSPGKFSHKTLFPKSPKQRKYKSPVKGSRMKSTSQLKSTNSIEAEISIAGIRKLKQTQLNPDFYKSRSQDGGSTSGCKSHTKLNEENKFGEDDLILESPKHSLNFYDEMKKNFRRENSEEVVTEDDDGRHSKSEAFDPEETFVSSTFIRNSLKDTKQPEREKQTSPNGRSPEYNTVPYPYKGSPVRKKAERMRLPGQTCMECNKYYKAILGEIDPRKLQEILNQCSRHRDQHYNIVDTPPGYWKPYLTATMDGSAGDDDDTHLDE